MHTFGAAVSPLNLYLVEGVEGAKGSTVTHGYADTHATFTARTGPDGIWFNDGKTGLTQHEYYCSPSGTSRVMCVRENNEEGVDFPVYPTENKVDGIVTSVEQCASHCKGYQYFGVANGGHDCSCSNTDPATDDWARPDNTCSKNCDAVAGTSGTEADDPGGATCGGPNSRTLYEFDHGYAPGWACSNQPLFGSPKLKLPGSADKDWGLHVNTSHPACKAYCDANKACLFAAIMTEWCYIFSADAEGSVCKKENGGPHYKKMAPGEWRSAAIAFGPLLTADPVATCHASSSVVGCERVWTRRLLGNGRAP